MSGAGRKHRAKQLTTAFLDDDWEATLGPDEALVRVVASTGSKNLTVQFLSEEARIEQVSIPGKFAKVIWIMRGDYLIVAASSVVRKLTVPQLQALRTAYPELVHPLHRAQLTAEPAAIVERTEAEEPELVNHNRKGFAAIESTSSESDD
jgi:hypothetical protein